MLMRKIQSNHAKPLHLHAPFTEFVVNHVEHLIFAISGPTCTNFFPPIELGKNEIIQLTGLDEL